MEPTTIIALGLFAGATIAGVVWGNKQAAKPIKEAADAIRGENSAQTQILHELKSAQENTARSMQEMSLRLSTMDARQERESSDLYRRLDALEGIQDSHAEALHTLALKSDALTLHVNKLETIVGSRQADKDAASQLASDIASDPPIPRSKA